MGGTLFIIPARGGSKGIPGKNIKLLGGRPLITYSIDLARKIADDTDICVSTDDEAIRQLVETYGLRVPFLRPPHLATDFSGSFEVLVHALQHYRHLGKDYSQVVLLQPTSPFRTAEQINQAISLYTPDTQMVVGVTEAKANPYFVLYEENNEGYLVKSKFLPNGVVRRQDAPKVYQVNGAVYVISVKGILESTSFSDFTRIAPFLMDDLHSVDLDTPLDWLFAEFLISHRIVQV